MRGHGAPGLIDSLRPFSDLADDSAGSRRPYLDFAPGVQIATWTPDSGRTYVARCHYVLDGLLRDVVGVSTDLGALTRAESLADCRSTAGTYFADINAATSPALTGWDDGTASVWDVVTDFWDKYPPLDLYVHLPGDADPNGYAVVALLGFFFSTKGEVHPSLGTDKLTNGSFDVNLTGWAARNSGGGNGVSFDGSTFFAGTGSAAFVAPAIGYAGIYQDRTTVAGAVYRLSGVYRTLQGMPATADLRLMVGDTALASILLEDGRNGSATGFASLRPTQGEWRRFILDVVAPAATTRFVLHLEATAAVVNQSAWFDEVKLQRVWRYNLYEPRLAPDALADSEIGSKSIFFEAKSVGIGALSLIDADGVLAPCFAQLLTSNKMARVALGGTLSDGQEVYREEWRDQFYGLSRDLWCGDDAITIELDDPTTLLLDTELPPKAFSLAEFPNLDLNRVGYAQPIVLGNFAFGAPAQDAVPLNRVDLSANGYGIYELCDVALTTGLYAGVSPTLYAYPTAQRRDDDISHPTYTLNGSDYSIDYAAGRLTITSNLRDFSVDASGKPLSSTVGQFNIGGGTLSAGAAQKTAEAQAAFLLTNWTAAAGVGITWTYNTTGVNAHKFTVSKAAGTLNLLCSSGDGANRAFWERHGFNTNVDRTGALSYTGDNVVFTTPEADHFFTIMHLGLKDDAAGSYSGTANAFFFKPGDLFNFLMRVYLGATVDQASVAAARSGQYSSKGCRLYLGSPTKIRDIVQRLGVSGLADVVVSGSGTWYYRPYQAGVAAGVIDFYDRDFLSFRCGRRPSDLFAKGELEWGHRPLTNVWRRNQYVADAALATKHGRGGTISTALSALDGGVSADVDALGSAFARLAAGGPRVVEFEARGKLVDALPGDKIRITRSRALDSTGRLAAVVFRILYLSRSPISGITKCLAVEDVSFA